MIFFRLSADACPWNQTKGNIRQTIIRTSLWFDTSSRRGRPPKQGLSSLSSYEDFNDDDSVRLKKYRVDDKESHEEMNGELKISEKFLFRLEFQLKYKIDIFET